MGPPPISGRPKSVDPATVEPVPVEAIPVEPIPVDAIPVVTVAPQPVETLPPLPVEEPFAWRSRPSRPGVVTALGVVSIVLSVCGFIVNFALAIWGFAALFIVGEHNRAAGPVGTPTIRAVVVDDNTQNGLTSTQQQAALDGLNDIRELSAPRVDAVRGLLAKSGQKLFSVPPERLSSERVKQQVTDSGRLFSDNDSGADYFDLPAGRLEVTDRQATFVFNDRGESTLRSETMPFDRSLTAAQLDNLSASLSAAAGLNPGVSLRWRTVLGRLRQSQAAFDPKLDASFIGSQILSARLQADDTMVIETPRGAFVLDNTGSIAPADDTPPTYTPGTAPKAAVQLDVTWPMVLLVQSGVAFLMSILLLVAGILALRSNRGAVYTHWAWTIIRLPMGVLAALAMGGTAAVCSDATSARIRPLTAASSFDLGRTVGAGTLLLLYPIAVMCVLLTPSVREHFSRRAG